MWFKKSKGGQCERLPTIGLQPSDILEKAELETVKISVVAGVTGEKGGINRGSPGDFRALKL